MAQMKKLLLFLMLPLAACSDREFDTCKAAVEGLNYYDNHLNDCYKEAHRASFQARQQVAHKYRNLPR